MGPQMTTMRRRDVLAGGGLAALALALPTASRAKDLGTVAQTSDLVVSPTRSTRLVAWAPARARGVVLFSTGHGSWPERYDRLAALLVADGFAVLAPVHVDSVHYPDRAAFTLQQSFPERLADMAAAASVAARRYPGLPVIAAGHSFGTLTALCLGGALGGMGPFRNPAVKAVLGFSTPGLIPGLIDPQAYASVAVPVMIVTGTMDALPAGLGYPSKPDDHLVPARTVPAGSYALVVGGADHGLVDDAARFDHAAPAARLFVEAYGLGDRRARRALDGWRAMPGDAWTVRKPGA